MSCKNDPEPIRRCITAGFFANAARLTGDGVCLCMLTKQGGNPVAEGKILCFWVLILETRRVRVYARACFSH